MTYQEILARVDHTLLAQTATWEEIRRLCDDAMFYHTASVCIPPCFVKKARDYVGNQMKICTVIGFPNGNATTRSKMFEAEDALNNGADELDMVINIGALKAKKYDYVEKEIRALKEIAGSRVLKVIIETCLLDEEEKIRMCEIVTRRGRTISRLLPGFPQREPPSRTWSFSAAMWGKAFGSKRPEESVLLRTRRSLSNWARPGWGPAVW